MENQEQENLPVYQANKFLQARKHYGIMEHRLLRMAIADLRPQLRKSKYYDDSFRPFHIDTKDLLEQFHGNSNNRIYEQLREACRNLAKVIEIGDITHFDIYAVFDRISFDIKSGLTLQFSRPMEQFLLQLEQGNYTRNTFLYK